MSRFRLHHPQHNLELSPGQYLIGRSTDCQLSVDDPFVARRHARLLVTDETVYVEDLGSRNGVFVDGVRIDGRHRLRDGSKVTVGAQEMVIVDLQRSSTGTPGSMAHDDGSVMRHPALPPSRPPSATLSSAEPSVDDPSRRVDALRQLGGVANKALALGRVDEAERILSTRLLRILETTRETPSEMPTEVVDQAARFAARLAEATRKGSWVDYVVALYAAQRRPFPALLVDELYTVLRKVGPIDIGSLRAYVQTLGGDENDSA